jgi:hypothetical protein
MSVQAEIISLILYHNSTFIITNLSKPAEISFVVGECHLNSEASLPPPHHHHSWASKKGTVDTYNMLVFEMFG